MRSPDDRVFNVLFLCTGNSARSIMAEAIMNRIGLGKFRAYSAGSQPKGQVHPQALALLRKLNHDTGGFRSKAGPSSANPGRRRSISFSPFATTPRRKPVQYGPASR